MRQDRFKRIILIKLHSYETLEIMHKKMFSLIDNTRFSLL